MKKFWEAHFLIIEAGLSIFFTACFVLGLTLLNQNAILGPLVEGYRKDIYTTLATIFGSLLGFVITAVSIIIGYSSSERLLPLTQSKHYKDLWATFLSTIKGLAFATIISFIGLIFDKDIYPNWIIFYLNLWITIFVIFRFGRCIWIFENILQILIKKHK
jgi:hypothetical protein